MTQPFSPEDLLAHRVIEDLVCGEAGPPHAVPLKEADQAADSYSSSVWIQPLDGSEARRFTTGGVQDRMPQWTPDGRTLAFLSDRSGGQAQINLIDLDGGEARQLGHVNFSLISYGWS